MVGFAFTMAEPYPGESRIVNMIKSCCVHNGERTWCDFSGPAGKELRAKLVGLPGSLLNRRVPDGHGGEGAR